MVVTLMCARGPTPHVERGRRTLQLHGFLYKHMGKLQRAVTLILRRESKICPVKSLVSIHSACPCKNYPPKCSQIPHELDYLFKFAFFFYLVFNKATRTLSRKKIVQKPPYNRAGCIVEPYNASRQPKFQFCQKVGKGRHVDVRAWAENIAIAWLPIQTYGKTSKGRNFNSKA